MTSCRLPSLKLAMHSTSFCMIRVFSLTPSLTHGCNRTSAGYLAGHPEYDRKTALDVLVTGLPGRETDTHSRAALPDRAAAPAGAVPLDPGYHFSRDLVAAKRYEHLVEL